MKQSDLNHLRRLLGWVRCDIGQSPGERQQTMIDVADGLRHPEISREAKARMVEAYHRAESIPLYVRAAVKALEKALTNGGPRGGVGATCATDETHYVDRGAAGGSGLPLSDFAMERGMAEVGITVWGPRAEDWVAGVGYAVRLMRECLPKAAAAALPNHVNAASNPIACRDAPAAAPTLRRDDTGGAGAARLVNPILAQNVDAIGIDTRCARMLRSHGIRRVGELVTYSTADLLRIPNFGRRSLGAVEECLQKQGLALEPARLYPVQESETC
ncbi:hypothetical protein KYT87_21410 [Achromobacter sp. ES-001]|uniref:DNA-directed RNA polymerase subunit alpha C-terminal domain-containing protein n=1 Tax=Achromobacter sp. ES-001 TaxID=2860286 RepID=UPI001C63F131|nr:DNA-directed RNA polymerase subunit alpha C-terminal domain-containing protein [Achromobacter sp. ES-001]QYJ20213.1 hypothetical protein KYT87_21410 [Achromobacter sp. ES-001]